MRNLFLFVSLLILSCFSSQGPLNGQTIFLEENFDAGTLPPGWSQSSAGSPSAGWEFGSSLSSVGFAVSAWDGNYAICNDDLHDNAAGTANYASDDKLRTPILNLAAASMVIVEFDYYSENDPSGSGSLLMSTDGGSSWSFIFFLSEHGAWTHFYFSMPYYSATTIFALRYGDGGTNAKGLAVDNFKVWEPDPLEGGIVRPYTSGQMPQLNGYIGGRFHSNGTDTVTTIGIAYSVDGGAPVNGTLSGWKVGLNRNKSFTHPVPVNFPSTGNHTLSLWITDLNGTGPDGNASNDTVTWQVEVLTSMPDPHPVVEDFTGAWCTFCSDNAWRFDQTLEAFPSAIGVAIHNGDQMDSASFAWTGSRMASWLNAGGGYPSCNTDHYQFDGNTSIEFFGTDYELFTHERTLMYRPVGAEITDVTWDAATRVLSGNVQATFYDTLTGDLRLNLFVTLDSLYGEGLGWDQTNGANTTPGHVYYGLGDPIIGFKHRHVLMSALGGEYGRGGVIPSVVYPGSTYSSNFSLVLPHIFWGALNQADSITPGLVNLVGLVQRYDAADVNNRSILNAVERELILSVQNEPVADAPGLMVYPNPSQGDLNLRLPEDFKGNYTLALVNALGTVVYQYSGSGNSISLSLPDLPEGVYSVVVAGMSARIMLCGNR